MGGGQSLLFRAEVVTVLSCSSFPAYDVSDFALEKNWIVIFFSGSNVGIKSFLGKERRNLVVAKNGEIG